MHRAMAGVAATSPTPESAIGDKNRRLTDKILTAFTFAYAAGEREVADTLRRALAQAEKRQPAQLCQRRRESALRRADLWVGFVEARAAYNRSCDAEPADAAEVETALVAMKEAYRRWSDGEPLH